MDWWNNEELNYQQFNDAIDLYYKSKPQIMVTHTCPTSILPYMNNSLISNSTSKALEIMFSKHQPEIWIFGHFHKSRDIMLENTNFICLNELEVKKIK